MLKEIYSFTVQDTHEVEEKTKKISTELLKYKNLSSKNKYELNSTLGQYYNFKHSYKESTNMIA